MRPDRFGMILVAALAWAGAAGCTKRNPRYCEAGNAAYTCPDGQRCNEEYNRCESPQEDGAVTEVEIDATQDEAVDVGCPAVSCASESPFCLSPGLCVECREDSDCASPDKPICDKSHACVPCTSDSQCVSRNGADPGVCVEGRCPGETQVIFVQNGGQCPGNGSKDAPFCSPQAAASAVTTGTRILLIRGPGVVDRFNVSSTGAPVHIIGQAGATIAPGAGNGISVSAGAVAWVRDLTISGGVGSVGVRAYDGSEVHIDRCQILNNVNGGIRISNAAFEITNTIIANNGPSSDPHVWGGVIFETAASGKLARFANNTVVGNKGSGMECVNHLITGSILFDNTNFNDVKCMVQACCAGSPNLDASYRLTGSSTACVDRLAPGDATSFDVDGEARPKGAKSDCGADEL